MPPKKIIYITHYSAFMGANRSLFDLITYLMEHGNIIPLVILPEEGEMSENLRKRGIELLITKSYPNFFRYKGGLSIFYNAGKQLLKNFITYRSVKKAARSLHDREYVLIHSNSSATDFGALLAKEMSLPHIWHFRENLKAHYFAHFIGGYSTQIRRYSNWSYKIITISDYLAKTFRTYIPEDKIITIYNGLKSKSTIPTKAKRNLTHPLKLCAVGLIHPSKQQEMLLQSMNQLVTSGVTQIKLYIVSGFSDEDAYYQFLKQYIESNGLTPYIEFTGYKPNAAEFIKDMDIGILASKDEAFGRVTIEYMQAGLIPLGYKSGATPELISHNENGFIFNSPEELTSIIKTLLADSELFERIRKNASASANNFPISKTALQIDSLYNQIIQSTTNEDYRRNRLL